MKQTNKQISLSLYLSTYLSIYISTSCSSFLPSDPPQKPTITPSKLTVATGDAVTLSCDTSSSPTSAPFSYTWHKGGADTGVTSQTLSVTAATASDSGSYICTVVDSGVSSPTSNAYTLTVVRKRGWKNGLKSMTTVLVVVVVVVSVVVLIIMIIL